MHVQDMKWVQSTFLAFYFKWNTLCNKDINKFQQGGVVQSPANPALVRI